VKDLSVGMYVRFKKGKITYIREILEVIHNYESFDVYRTAGEYFDYEEKDYFDIVYPNEIIGKPSYNIIDLIEIGDYANGQKVNKIIVDKDISNNDKLKFGDDDLVLTFKSNHDTYYLYVEDIESIVTKEQFESMKYVVEKE